MWGGCVCRRGVEVWGGIWRASLVGTHRVPVLSSYFIGNVDLNIIHL